MFAKKLKNASEELEIDVQLLCSELDSSGKNLRVISRDDLDIIFVDNFDSLINDIENGAGTEISSLDDNTTMYEYLDDVVVIHNVFGNKKLIFDKQLIYKIENKIRKFDYLIGG